MSFKTRVTAAAAVLTLTGGGLALTATSAPASTLKCTATESCGGADLAFQGHGPLSLAVLATSSVNGGFGYNNEEVGFTTSGASDGSQDITVFQKDGQPAGSGGYYGYGDYVAMYTPGGKLPLNTHGDGAGNGASVAYCVSVEDTYPTVGGHVVQRWALVLRNCFAWPGTVFHAGTHASTTPPVAEVENTVSSPDLYQEWSPTETSDSHLEFQDLALNTTFYRHGWNDGHNFVMDDRAFGGTGTWGLAYPENDGLNQKFTIIGCTEPVTAFNTAYYNCPS